MNTSIASSCVLLSQQREQMIQYLRQGGSVSIVPCHTTSPKRTGKTCTVIENGRVIVKPLCVQAGQIKSVQG